MYKCLMRVRTSDGVIHQPGDVIQLNEQEAKNCLSSRAVQFVPDVQTPAAAPSTPSALETKSVAPAQPTTPNPPVHNVTPKDGEA